MPGQCERCGKVFLSSVGSQKWCSRKCEDAVRKADARESREKEIIKLLNDGMMSDDILVLKQGPETERIIKRVLKRRRDETVQKTV
jgi:hypothetical protein